MTVLLLLLLIIIIFGHFPGLGKKEDTKRKRILAVPGGTFDTLNKYLPKVLWYHSQTVLQPMHISFLIE